MEKFEGYVYLDHHYPPILWNIMRGGFCSVECLPPEEFNFAVSISLASMMRNLSAERLRSELCIEVVRKRDFPNAVSRLKGIFVFDDVESVSQLWEGNRWGGHFEDQYLADVGVSAKRSTRADANWIDDALNANGALNENWEELVSRYWAGEPHPRRQPIWERIVEGCATVWSIHSKRSALEEIEAIWPDSKSLFTIS